MYYLPPFLSAAVAGAFGGFILLREWRQWMGRLLAVGLLSVAVMEFAAGMSIVAMRFETALFWCEWAMTSAALVGGVWLPLSLIIARRDASGLLRKAAWYLIPVGLMALGGFLIVFSPWSILADMRVRRAVPYIVLNRHGQYLCMFLLGCTLAALVNLESTLRSAENSARRRVKNALLGLIGAFVFQGYVLSVALLLGGVDAFLLSARSVAFLLAVLLLTYAVLRERLLNVDVYVGREVVYASVTLLGAGAYLVAAGVLIKVLQVAGVRFNLFVTSAGGFLVLFLLAVALLNEGARKRVRLFVDRNFYRNQHDYRVQWERFSARTSAVLDRETIAERIVNFVGDTLYVERVALLLTDAHARRVTLSLSRDAQGNLERVHVDGDLSPALRDWLRDGEPLLFEKAKGETEGRKTRAKGENFAFRLPPFAFLFRLPPFAFLSAGVCVPLRVEGTPLGLLVVGRKLAEKDYSREDLELLTTLSRQASVALLNTQLAEELATAKEIESFHKLTSFVLHDVKNCIAMLSLLMQNAESNFHHPEFQRDALRTIGSTVSKMQGLIQRLAEARSVGTAMNRLTTNPVNVCQLVEESVERFKISLPPGVRLETHLNGASQVPGDAEALQKVLTNLLINAVEALNGQGTITVRSSGTTEGVQIAVSDTGCGMSAEFVEKRLFQPFASTKSKGLGIGLYQCKAIVEAHGGRIDVDSVEGKGTTFTVTLPVRDER